MNTRLAIFTTILLSHGLVFAETPPVDTAEAGKRFTAGVALYNEADYRAALVEFKRAYEIAPSAVVLYNIGQTHYQLQDYAAAYVVLSRYLAEAGPTAEHATEVTQTVQLLQSRIGKITITSDPIGAEVTVDDELIGKTPLASPVLVSVGRRRVSVALQGRTPWTRTIEVAAGDNVRQEVVLEAPEARPVALPTPVVRKEESTNLLPVAWAATGFLAVGALTMGIVAMRASNDLDDLREQYPVERAALTKQSNKVELYSYLADGFGAATIVVGVTALTFTLLRRGDRKSAEKRPSVGIGPSGILVGGTF